VVLLHNNLLFIQWTTKILISLKLLKNLGTSVPEIFGILPKFSKTQNFWVCPYATVQNSQVWLLITQEKGITLLASFGRCQCFNHPSYRTIVTRFNRLGACCQRWPWIRSWLRQDSAFFLRIRSQSFVKNRTCPRSHFSISAVAGVRVAIS